MKAVNSPWCLQGTSQDEAQSAAHAAAVKERCQCIRLHFLTGDIKKVLLSRGSFAGKFSAITVGHRHLHLVDPDHGLAPVGAPGCLLAVETAKYMLQLTSKQVCVEEATCC